MQSRVDALHLRFRGGLDLRFRQALLDALATTAEIGGRPVAIELGPWAFQLSPKSRDGWWHLENRDLAVTMVEGANLSGWGLTVKLRAQTLAMMGARACARLAQDIATHLLHLVEDERVAWLDLCTDVVGFDVESIVPRQWVASGQAKARRLSPSPEESRREWYMGGERIAYYVGKDALVLRVYDKTVELQNDAHGDKRAAEHTRWRERGWNGSDRVTRVEFQMRGAAVKEIDDGRLFVVDTFADRLDAVWKYLTFKWVRLCIPDTATRRSRWAVDPRWRSIQRVTFGVDHGEVASRSRLRGVPPVNYVASLALSFAAKSGMLDGMSVPSMDEVAAWPPERARGWVRGTMAAILGSVGDVVSHGLLAQFGPLRSARFLAERLRSARARASSVLASASPVAFDAEALRRACVPAA